MPTRALIIRGHQGTGKTTLGHELSQHFGACLLSKDALYLPALAEINNHHVASRIAYDAMRTVVTTNRESGILFALDAPFHQEEDVDSFGAVFAEHDIVTRSILLVCGNYDIWNKRLQSRAANPSPNHLLTSLEQLASVRSGLEAVRLPGELILDTTADGNDPPRLAELSYNYIMGAT